MYRRSNITITLLAALSAVFSSCGTLLTAYRPSPAVSTETLLTEPLYIENFYAIQEPLPTQAPEPLYQFTRGGERNPVLITTIAGQRTLDQGLLEESALFGDIGGDDITPLTDTEEDSNETILPAGTTATGSGLVEINDFGTATSTAEKFDPAKMTTSITIDALMDDVSCFTLPVDGVVNSNYGWRHGRVHSGIDLDLETGDPVYAAFDGEVTTAAYHGGYGNLVVLKHANGLETYYAHLSKIQVQVGDKIMSGDALGLGGSTGRSTGPHLHFEIRYKGASFDPAELIDFKNQELKTTHLVLTKNTFKVSSASSGSGAKGKTSTKKYYTVKKGDTLGKIAARNKTTVSKLCKLNGISSKKVLKPGMKLRVK
jgi:murein DD-endopeptidase MepM/ murein hydrolase activator NlpD